MTASLASDALVQRLRTLPGNVKCMIMGRRHQVDIIRDRVNRRLEKRPDEWFSEQAAVIRDLELLERITAAIARDPAGFVKWAGLSA